MVNRVLIRIKVVQMLYSYLLTRSEFRLNEAPETTSRDKRYAYTVYIDMVLLLLELSGYNVKSNERPQKLNVERKLQENKVAKALSQNDAIRTAILRGNTQVGLLDDSLPSLYNKILESKVYIDYKKNRNTELGDDVILWTTILETIIARDESVTDALRKGGDFSLKGFQKGIKDLCNTLMSYADSREFFKKAKRDLEDSLDKAYELYLSIFAMIIDLTDEHERRLETAKQKHLATSDDRNPNTKLLFNQLAEYLRNSEHLKDLLDEYKVKRWSESSHFIRSMLDKVIESDVYKAYVEQPRKGLEEDAEFWRDALRTVILPSDLLMEEMEDQSLYWNDDLQTMGTFALKTLRQIAQSGGETVELLPKFKDIEDEKFGPELFRYSVENQPVYRQYIERFIQHNNWDPERLAFMDIVIMTTAIAEIIHYPNIPVAVSVNEYVEIANNYSTEKSGGFINGMLYNIIKYLNDEGIIHKA
ncbi:MAG: transcription antitermination protein NusB [Bacteroidales bacterium]|nr:transcription antitermination protein NusB [Bacteroidales bacterium]